MVPESLFYVFDDIVIVSLFISLAALFRDFLKRNTGDKHPIKYFFSKLPFLLL